jgi:hypothetical protein
MPREGFSRKRWIGFSRRREYQTAEPHSCNSLRTACSTSDLSQAENCRPGYNMVHERILEFF